MGDDGVHQADRERSLGARSVRRCRRARARGRGPTRRASRCVPPKPGITPSLTSGWPNFGLVRGVDEVARERELAAAAEREAVDRRDHREAAPPRARARPLCPASRSACASAGVIFDISAMSAPATNALSPGAGQDRDARPIGLDALERRDQRSSSASTLAIQRVELVGAVDRDRSRRRSLVDRAGLDAASQLDRQRSRHAFLLALCRRTRRSRGRSSCRASRRRRSCGAARPAGTCRRRARGAAPRRSRGTVSRPIRSASSSGPIGWLRPSLRAGVDVLGGAEPSCSAKQASLSSGMSMRLTMKPGLVLARDHRLAEPLRERRGSPAYVSSRRLARRARSRRASSAAPDS